MKATLSFKVESSDWCKRAKCVTKVWTGQLASWARLGPAGDLEEHRNCARGRVSQEMSRVSAEKEGHGRLCDSPRRFTTSSTTGMTLGQWISVSLRQSQTAWDCTPWITLAVETALSLPILPFTTFHLCITFVTFQREQFCMLSQQANDGTWLRLRPHMQLLASDLQATFCLPVLALAHYCG